MTTQEKKPIYPDQLNIIIRTSVPGYQQINYVPSMTIKNTEEKSVKFNPLLKLYKSVVDKIPEEYRIKQFFNKGLFQSLQTYNGGRPAGNLLQATRYGYVDNNINVTIHSIFPVGSVIYIGKTPYAIGDVQWTTGDWKIEVKQKKEEIDPSKVTDPKLYTQLVSEEIISGEEQLNQLPQVLLMGANYTGPPVVKNANASGAPISSATTTPPITPSASPIANMPIKQEQEQEEAQAQEQQITQTNALMPPPIPFQKKAMLMLPPSEQRKPLLIEQPPKIEELTPQEEKLYESFNKNLVTNTNATHFFRRYFQAPTSYQDMIFLLYLYFPQQIKKEVINFYYKTTHYVPKKTTEGFSSASYNKLCDQVSIIKSPGDGDCFFAAVADGINLHNYENIDSKIYYANYGKTQLFTISILREIVLRYILDLGSNKIKDMLDISESYVDILNDKFKQVINGLKDKFNIDQLTTDQYLAELNNVYQSDNNFLIYKPKVVPIDIDEYENPFRILKPFEISNYIKSKDYWANDVAIEAICEKLQICIIPIENLMTTRNVTLKYIKKIAPAKRNVERLRMLLTNNDVTKTHCSKKVMFLYYKKNHYELIRFEYMTKLNQSMINQNIQNEVYNTKKYYTIFKDGDISPPIHILFLLYGSIYNNRNEQYKQDFGIYLNFMKMIDYSVQQIVKSKYAKDFVYKFNDYFISKNPLKIELTAENRTIPDRETSPTDTELMETNSEFPDEEDKPTELVTDTIARLKKQGLFNRKKQIGGQPYPPYYAYPQNATTMIKKADDRDASKIAYSIIIDMELHPGTSLSPEQISKSKCNGRYNAIRKAFSEFVGKPYVIPPVYNKTIKNTNNKSIKKIGGKTRKNV
jgi:hypothetical protein